MSENSGGLRLWCICKFNFALIFFFNSNISKKRMSNLRARLHSKSRVLALPTLEQIPSVFFFKLQIFLFENIFFFFKEKVYMITLTKFCKLSNNMFSLLFCPLNHKLGHILSFYVNFTICTAVQCLKPPFGQMLFMPPVINQIHRELLNLDYIMLSIKVFCCLYLFKYPAFIMHFI